MKLLNKTSDSKNTECAEVSTIFILKEVIAKKLALIIKIKWNRATLNMDTLRGVQIEILEKYH